MNKQRAAGLCIGLLLIVQAACALPTQLAAPTATPVPLANNAGGQGSGNGNSTGSTPSATPLHTATPTLTPTITPTATPSPSPSPSPETGVGPYTVKQTETLGGETISGMVCSILKPFAVNYQTPPAPFTTAYTPKDAQGGTWSYAYSIPKAGESHDAKGSYTLSGPNKDGVLTLTMTGSDHVVFKGFDGNIPSRYKFDLVPAVGAPCP